MFQFLLGRLETGQLAGRVAIKAWFQFLLGRLETIVTDGGREVVVEFQFLLGRLETRYHYNHFLLYRGFNSS